MFLKHVEKRECTNGKIIPDIPGTHTSLHVILVRIGTIFPSIFDFIVFSIYMYMTSITDVHVHVSKVYLYIYKYTCTGVVPGFIESTIMLIR